MNEPLVPSEVSMRGLPYMPLQIERLQKSKAWLVCKRRPDLAFYILNLWMRAWAEAPAGSIEDDPDVLADAAMCPPDKFGQYKDDALRGWILCSDGRWYHPTICEIALETWEKRTGAEKKRAEDRERKRREREALRQSQSADDVSGGSPNDIQGNPSENALKGREGKNKGREEDTCPKRSRVSYPQEFDGFWTDYPTDALMSKKKAFEAWKRLSDEDRGAARAAIPAFREHCRKNPDYRPVHAERFITQRRFDGFNAAPKGTGIDPELARLRDIEAAAKAEREGALNG